MWIKSNSLKKLETSVSDFEKLPASEKIKRFLEQETGDTAEDLLHPKEAPYIYHLEAVVERLKREIARKTKISLVTDYDADGIMSALILYLTLKSLGSKPNIFIPRRFSDGYGLSMNIIDKINEGLILTADNGIATIEQIKAAKEKGLSVIVTDHHIGDITKVPADIVLDPNAEEYSEYKQYCGAGIAWRIAKELVTDKKLLDMLTVFAGIATVADVMKLTGDNRNIVRKSLELINKRQTTTGLIYLLTEIEAGEHLSEEDYGFKIGPIINASGRLYDEGPMDVVKLFSAIVSPFALDAKMDKQLKAMAMELVERNEDRKRLVEKGEYHAQRYIEEHDALSKSILVVKLPELERHDGTVVTEGVIGIIAGHLAEKYCRPTLCFADSHTKGILKGSARTSGTINLKEMLDSRAELFEGYGGHAGAAGMSIKGENLEVLAGAFGKYLEKVKYVPLEVGSRFYDLEIKPEEFMDILSAIDAYAPFGEGCPKPVIKIADVKLLPSVVTQGFGRDKVVKTEYAKFLGKEQKTLKFQSKSFDAIMFDGAQKYLDLGSPKTVSLLGNPGWNWFRDQCKPQMLLTDIEVENASIDVKKADKKDILTAEKTSDASSKEAQKPIEPDWFETVADIDFT